MDLVRSCYKRRIRYVAGDPSQTAVATWYFAAPGARAFPFPHAFASANWDSVHPTAVVLGDDESFPRSWYNGRIINRSDGTDFAGPPQFFADGADMPALLPRGQDGFTPIECLKPPFGIAIGGLSEPIRSAIGGKTLSGSSVPGIAPGAPCGNCPAFTPLRTTVTAAGFVAPYTAFNGTHVLTQSGACTWNVAIGPHAIFALRGPGFWVVQMQYFPGPLVADYLGPSPDCLSTTVCPFFAGPFGNTAVVNILGGP